MPHRNAETELEETEKVALRARQRAEYSRLATQGLGPTPSEGLVRSLTVFEEQGVISSWWVARSLGVSGINLLVPTGLGSTCVCVWGGQHTVDLFHWGWGVGGLQHLQNSYKDMAQNINYSL